MRKGKRLLCGALALLMVLSLLTAGAVQQAYAAAASQQSEEQKKEEEQKKAEEQKQRQAEMDELEKQKQEKRKNLEELRKQIAEAKSKKEDVMGTKNLLDQQNQILMEQIDDTKQQIDLYAQQIETYQEMEEEQYSLFCQQVRSEEERGSLSYWSVLFKATSIADLLNRLEFVNEVAEYDRNLIEAIRQTRENIKTDKAAMEEQEALLEFVYYAVRTLSVVLFTLHKDPANTRFVSTVLLSLFEYDERVVACFQNAPLHDHTPLMDALDRMREYCEEKERCRRNLLVEHFGERTSRSRLCDEKDNIPCDNCEKRKRWSGCKKQVKSRSRHRAPPPRRLFHTSWSHSSCSSASRSKTKRTGPGS